MAKKVILVTGARGGIGRAVVKSLRKHNAIVFTTDLDVPKNFSKISPSYPADFTVESDVESLFLIIKKIFGRLDLVVNCAGIGIFKPIDKITGTEWESLFKVNTYGAFLLSREAVKIFKKQRGGRIFHFGSVAEHRGLAGNSAYGASKAALHNLGAVINTEYKMKNIHSTHIRLGAVYSPIWEGRKGFSKSEMLDPIQVGNLVSYLARLPLGVRIDEIELLPRKGIL